MKRIALTLISVAAIALAGCDGTQDTLNGGGGGGGSPNGTASNEPGNTFDHNNDPGAGDPSVDQPVTDPAAVQAQGAPEVTSRMHGCGKLTYASLGSIITSRGFGGAGTGAPAGAQTAQQIYANAASAFGAANYAGRVPEAPFASTSALSKEFDIFTMGSYAAAATTWAAPDCPNVKLLGTDGKFTKDGLSCLMGKPATDEHVALANDAITKNSTDGAKIAIAALLSAAHTCQ